MQERESEAREAWSSLLRSRFDACVHSAADTTSGISLQVADLELKVAEEQIALARQHRNKVLGPCRLPPEILSSIFQLAKAEWPVPRFGWTPKCLSVAPSSEEPGKLHIEYELGWMVLLHVCSAWRQAAIGAPFLWTRVPVMDLHIAAIPTFLARSRGLPLSIYVNTSVWPVDGSIPIPSTRSWLCKSVFRRTAVLAFDEVADIQLQRWLNSLCYPMPLLRSFEVDNLNHEGQRLLSALPGDVFARSAPCLREVIIFNSAFTWDSVLLSPDIVGLSLGIDSGEIDEAYILPSLPSSQQFYATLTSMNNLKRLTLRNILPLSTEGMPPGYALSLPESLNLLEIHTTIDPLLEPAIALFTNARIPTHTRALLSLDVDELDHIHARLPTLIGILFEETQQSFLELNLSAFAICMMDARQPFDIILTSNIPDSFSSMYPARLDAGSRCLWARFSAEELSILAYISLLPLSALQIVTISQDAFDFFSRTPCAWTSAFATAQNVHSIAIPFTSALSLFDAMGDTEDACNQATPFKFLLFPRLKNITLHKDPSDSLRQERGPTTFADKRAELGVSLVECLQVRIEKGAAVQRLLVADVLSSWDVWARVQDLTRVEFFPTPSHPW